MNWIKWGQGVCDILKAKQNVFRTKWSTVSNAADGLNYIKTWRLDLPRYSYDEWFVRGEGQKPC